METRPRRCRKARRSSARDGGPEIGQSAITLGRNGYSRGRGGSVHVREGAGEVEWLEVR